MPLSSAGLEAALAPQTNQVFLECLTISHASISDILLVNDKVDLPRTAGTFVAFPFQVRLHPRSDERTIDAQIVADNVDQRIVQNLRGLSAGASVTYEVVLQSQPNTVEQGPFDFNLQGFVADALTVQLQLGFGLEFLNEKFPKDVFAPWNTG